ncbi:MAG: DNA translocase FtsK 4TM domain-containing protein [Candidatus Solibacter sp.]|nr:DNA translocase FtsK 4TM domain-containing protein [Candidatus Solibacter sp.]
MKLLSPTQHRRLNEIVGFLLLSLGLVMLLSLVSYHTQDPSFDTAAASRPLNLVGYPGSYLSDVFFQMFGAAAFLFPLLTFLLSWKWIRSEELQAGGIKVFGSVLLTLALSAGLSFAPLHLFAGTIRIGGTLGLLLANYLVDSLNVVGALLVTLTAVVISVYLVSTFTLATLAGWMAGPAAWFRARGEAWRAWRERVYQQSIEKAREKAAARRAQARAEKPRKENERERTQQVAPLPSDVDGRAPWDTLGHSQPAEYAGVEEPSPQPGTYAAMEEIPICQVEELAPVADLFPALLPAKDTGRSLHRMDPVFRLPPTDLLNEPPPRNPYDEQELKETASRIKAKFEEFNVLGNVVQINPGPVVTTFEFKPEAGIKYTRIISLREDLCLSLHAESILIERIPGKPTVGIEVPNTRRELIALRQLLESDEFQGSHSYLTIPLGKDINGRIRVAALETMPHLLIAGSTESGKSVMINSMIMSILYKATPDEVRLIMVDPKRVELGMYEGIPHLLTPVITDPKKATNALRNAVLEMERRLRLLAEYGVRNIDQFNKKIRKLQETPRDLFAEEGTEDAVRPLPYILILIDELADLMMLEGKNVEESVTRLAQMARAVGMHLVLATQRPSVDVITGLIKANFPARISFRVATRVDSRTILDVMGSEHLLGKGDMLFLPPGSARLTRVHGAFVTETEIQGVVDFWKAQAKPEYDQSFLIAPPDEGDSASEGEVSDEDQDPQYEDAVRLVLQMGKASTSTLQRHLRLGYGRAARILDCMQRDGIIGPPDGSKPREVLKRPDWLHEVELR